MNLLAISGSLRKDSLNTHLAKAFIARAPEGVTITLADISKVPLYNQDHEADYPAEAKEVREAIRAADGVIIVTPEYNRSIPGVLKNVIDWTSRPYGDGAWNAKPVYITGATGGTVGTAVAQAALKPVFGFLNALVMGQPEFYLTGAADKFGPDGALTDASTGEHIDKGLAAFVSFVNKVK